MSDGVIVVIVVFAPDEQGGAIEHGNQKFLCYGVKVPLGIAPGKGCGSYGGRTDEPIGVYPVLRRCEPTLIVTVPAAAAGFPRSALPSFVQKLPPRSTPPEKGVAHPAVRLSR